MDDHKTKSKGTIKRNKSYYKIRLNHCCTHHTAMKFLFNADLFENRKSQKQTKFMASLIKVTICLFMYRISGDFWYLAIKHEIKELNRSEKNKKLLPKIMIRVL